MMNTMKLKASVIALCVASALGGAYSVSHLSAIGDATAATTSEAAPRTQPYAVTGMALPDMAGIVERNAPAVVNISITGTRKVANHDSPFPRFNGADPFGEFFRRFGGTPQQRNEQVRGQGSGFIVSADGTVLTNAHVVEDASEVTVKLNDKREFKAKVKGVDKTTDVAVLKIDAKDLPTVKIGNPANVRVGEWVLAIGAPFGFENSATAGIVSAKGRSLPDGSYVPFLQTDVAVNPGNSGGPLFNMAGEVIGVNSQIYSSSGGYQGLSFAIPIDVAMNIEQQIVTNGKVHRGRMGVVIQEIDQSLADTFGLKKPAGALVNTVEKGGPAARAGIQPGDVILAINGKPINGSSELPAIVAAMGAGEIARLDVWRDRAARTIDVKVGSFEEPKVAKAGNYNDEGNKSRLGIAVRPLTPGEQREAEVDGGLVVQDVTGAAARAGIQPGDVILSVNGQRVASVEQLRAVLAKSGKRVAVLVERGDARLFVPVDIG